MSETTANLWWIDEREAQRLRRGPLLVGLLIGMLLGAGVTALAAVPLRSAAPPSVSEVEREWPHRPLAGEWRFRKAPVDVDRMFRRR